MADLFKIPGTVITEANVEKTVSDYAGFLGWVSHRYQIPGQRGASDRIYMKLNRVFFVEFKRPKKEPTIKQRAKMMERRANGFIATWSSDVDHGIKMIEVIDRFIEEFDGDAEMFFNLHPEYK